MQCTINKLPKSQVEIEITLASAEWEEFLNAAAGELAKEIKVDGFRPGKAPRQLVESYVGSQKLLETAADLAVRKSYVQAVMEKNIEAIGRPAIDVMKIGFGSLFVFKATVTILPAVELGDYKKIAKEIKNKSAEELEPIEKDIANALEYIRKSRVAKESMPTEQNKANEQAYDKKKAQDQSLSSLSEINDDFARSLGKFKDLVELKNSICDGLKMENKEKEKQRWRIEMITKLAEQSKMEIPEVLILSELDKMIEELKGNILSLGMELDKYLEEIKKTEEDLRKEWRKKAEERVMTALCLRALADKEKIEVSQEEVDKESIRLLNYYNQAGHQVDIDYLKEYTKGMLKNEKVFQLLEGFRA